MGRPGSSGCGFERGSRGQLGARRLGECRVGWGEDFEQGTGESRAGVPHLDHDEPVTTSIAVATPIADAFAENVLGLSGSERGDICAAVIAGEPRQGRLCHG